MILVKYECGCVGFPPDGSKEGPVIIQACDRGANDDPLQIARRPGVETKKFEEINPLAQGDYMRRLGELINDGYTLRSVRAALGLVGLDMQVKKLRGDVDVLQIGE
jgi:hypothetical protein